MTTRQLVTIGKNGNRSEKRSVTGDYVRMSDGEEYYKISNYDSMNPFFMSIVSDSDHWIFISSTGGLTAGRRSCETALFPYYTEDKITESTGHTGSCTLLKIEKNNQYYLWEPFSDRYTGVYDIQRNLYKSIYGNSVLFEEINNDLGFTFSYSWRTSDKYGIVRSSRIVQNSESGKVEILDGIQNILPYGTTSLVQNTFSVLLDAYKRNECDKSSGLGIFSLSSILTDQAEPSEALKATTVWHTGLENVTHLVSSHQISSFRQGHCIKEENDIRGRRGSYFVSSCISIEKGEEKEWHIVAELNQDPCKIASLRNSLIKNRGYLTNDLKKDIAIGTVQLKEIVSRADGIHLTNDKSSTVHHYANVMFNTMRGGIFADNYSIESKNLAAFARLRNQNVYNENKNFFDSIEAQIDISDLIRLASDTGNHDIIRICYEYLPLTFSRRHGDPSRPWNHFSINIRNEDGSRRLDYQGNWRDIFQNWEALAYSYPEFVESMIIKFLNATTADGYNPYRVTADGIDWEAPEEGNPWANIGYWSDHQIIYLQKLLEASDKFHPGELASLLGTSIFSHANVPYRICSYDKMLEDYYSTISFDHKLEKAVEEKVKEIGSDGTLILDNNDKVFHVTLAEKMLILLLAKISNLVPEGGIWMNTQRPEWNDANNALVGKGLSMVTVYHLLRYVSFSGQLFKNAEISEISITEEVKSWFDSIFSTIKKYESYKSFSDIDKRKFMDEMGFASSKYRDNLYTSGFTDARDKIDISQLTGFLSAANHLLTHTIKANRRSDGLYHSYNVISIDKSSASVENLYEMLEGQVAVLSSGYLNAEESLELLDALRSSKMYREDQHSYMLYPDRDLKCFLEKNSFTKKQADASPLIKALIDAGNSSIVQCDENGVYHFNGSFRNVKDLKKALDLLQTDRSFSGIIATDKGKVLGLFEEVFNHNAFTGRSGTFFAYEGLGSIYWHMVSKLLLAVQEIITVSVDEKCPDHIIKALCERYYDIRKGLGFNKSPDNYGAFPTDPYSHTPREQGARQPGMTGQVKEEVISRLGEVGIIINNGSIKISPVLLRSSEFLKTNSLFEYYAVDGSKKVIILSPGSLAITFCQTPIVIVDSNEQKIAVTCSDNSTIEIDNSELPPEISQKVFKRDGSIEKILIYTSQELIEDLNISTHDEMPVEA